MSYKKIFPLVFLSVISHSLMAQRQLSQELKDTSSFSPNEAEGWAMYANYVEQLGTDSAVFEIIVKVPQGVDLRKRQLIGRINKKNLLPEKIAAVPFELLPYNDWNIRITPRGKCFVELVKGEPPAEDPIVLPLKARFALK